MYDKRTTQNVCFHNYTLATATIQCLCIKCSRTHTVATNSRITTTWKHAPSMILLPHYDTVPTACCNFEGDKQTKIIIDNDVTVPRQQQVDAAAKEPATKTPYSRIVTGLVEFSTAHSRIVVNMRHKLHQHHIHQLQRNCNHQRQKLNSETVQCIYGPS